MATVLVISSQVAASRVGASAGAFVLRRLGHEAIVLPTVLLGRHPGWGAPGGGAIPAAHLRSVWEAVRAQDVPIDAVQTGYFADASQIALAAEIIDALAPPTVMVDPVIGDDPRGATSRGATLRKDGDGLYVAETVANAIRDQLVPRAHIVTPNAWEHGWLTAARPIPGGVAELITSYDVGPERIGALYRDRDTALSVAHERFADVPHGGGDTLAALWLAHALEGLAPAANLARSVGGVLGLLRAATQADRRELPLAREQHHLLAPEPLQVTHI